MSALRFLLTRFAGLVLVLWALVTIIFLLQTTIPSDPARAYAGPGATHAQLLAERHALGLDRPVSTRYWHYLRGVVHGDLQQSVTTREPVSADLGRYLPATIELVATALSLAVVLGLVFGALTARPRRGGTAMRLGLLAGAAVPSFCLALVALLVLYVKLRVLPGGGRLSPRIDPPPGPTGLYTVDALVHGQFGVLADALWHLVLPAVCLSLAPALVLARTLRSSLRSTMGLDHIRTARSKGISEPQVLRRHALRNAIGAPLTLMGLEAGALLASDAVVETIFSWPGIGQYADRAIANQDLPAITGFALVTGAIYVVINALVDVAQVAADPRLGS